MFKEIYLSSCEESASYHFETELSTKEILDVIAELYAQENQDFFGVENVFDVFYSVWDWEKLKEKGIHPVERPKECINLWGWNTIGDRLWDDRSSENDVYLINKIKDEVFKKTGKSVDDLTAEYEERSKKEIEGNYKYLVNGVEVSKQDALAEVAYTFVNTDYHSSQEMKGEKKHGKFLQKSNDGLVIEKGQYLDDQKDGEWERHGDGVIVRNTFNKGRILSIKYEYLDEVDKNKE